MCSRCEQSDVEMTREKLKPYSISTMVVTSNPEWTQELQGFEKGHLKI